MHVLGYFAIVPHNVRRDDVPRSIGRGAPFIAIAAHTLYLGGLTEHPTDAWTVQTACNPCLSHGERLADARVLVGTVRVKRPLSAARWVSVSRWSRLVTAGRRSRVRRSTKQGERHGQRVGCRGR
jgi:hypothetical protein